jgi:hypothetical protein
MRASVQPSTPESVPVSLLVLESGATFPFEATGYRRAPDTAILIQQPGESETRLADRIRRAARQLRLAGVPIATVALVVDQNSGQSHPERHRTALALLEQLSADDARLLLIAEGARRPLRHELIALAGTLIERDHVTRPIAIEFNALHIAELGITTAPGTGLPARRYAEVHDAHAC